jgi:hypothetical protein
MASRGFEWGYNLDGTGGGPVIRDWPIGTIDANMGDALTIDSGGYGTSVGTATSEVLGILMEDTGGTVTAYANRKVAIATREQVWRCSMDAAATSFVIGYTKTIQFVDGNTIDADGSTSGPMILVDTGMDDDANVLAYVAFVDTTFGNT